MGIQFRYARRSLWRWQQYALTGMPKDNAVQLAKDCGDMYEANWLQASADGITWVDVPSARQIPLVDETVGVSGKVYGG